jgi:hypothetical protein
MNDIRTIDFGSNEAKYDNLERYFYDNGDVNRILEGRAHLIVGRKGSGKTAIATYIIKSAQNTYQTEADVLSGREIPLGLIDKFQDSRFMGPSKFVPVWRYILLLELAKLVLHDQTVPPIESERLTAFLELNCPDLKAKAVDYLSSTIEMGMKLKVKVIEAHLVKKQSEREEEIDLLSYLDGLEDCLIRSATLGNRYLLFCDELDDIYESRPNDYNDILIGLLKAIDQINSSCEGKYKTIRAVALLRDDIYKKLQYSDRNKIKDRRIDIDWSIGGGSSPMESALFKMINLRIGASIDGVPDPNKNYWNSVITKETVIGNVRPFSYLLTRTFLRPRDIIEYTKCLQRVCRDKEISVAHRKTFKWAEEEYSDWFRDELVDEVSAIVPDIEVVLEAIRDHGQSSFYAKDINRYFQKAKIQSEASVNIILNKLFDFSAIGIFDSPSSRSPEFKYRIPTKRFRPKKKCSVHYGLRNCLELR